MATNRSRHISEGAAALQLLGDDTRRAIVEELVHGPSSVGDLAGRLPVTRSAVSQHLAALKTARLVSDSAEGTKRIYRLDPAGIQLLRTYLDHMWASALESFGDAAVTNATTTKPTPTRSTRTRKRST